MKLYVQYGCGLCAPESWKNYDASPTLRVQRVPLISYFAKRKVKFPGNVMYGDIIKGLSGINENACDAVYCSHTLEHLSLDELYTALHNTCKILKPGGIFRCVLPDLEFEANKYLAEKETNSNASVLFMKSTMLGVEKRSKSLKNLLFDMLGNSAHLWMWDHDSLKTALLNAGFSNVRKCVFNDSAEKAFIEVEDKRRFDGALALEAIK